MKSWSVVRVVEPSRLNKDKLLGVKGTPYVLRPQNPDETDLIIEEMSEPHRDGDALPADRDGDDPQASSSGGRKKGEKEDVEIEDAGMKVMDYQLRITQKDLNEFGYTDGCPKCQDIEAERSWNRSHNDDCRLRSYMAYQRSEHPKWKAIRHLFESDDKAKFPQGHVDVEHSPTTPKALDGTNMFDEHVFANAPKSHEPNKHSKRSSKDVGASAMT